ncbi:MAG TPA: NADH-quinone oxidoreductase subunit I [Chloroflexia bacterium]|nr:NADH-quinone oxidoreductase subunit I [Chloroflexia bacterium]
MAIFDEIARGMGVTLRNFFKKPITVQYPKQMRNFHPRFRGAVGFVRDQETGKERCVGCGLCSAVCPANCLTVVPGVDEHGIRNAKIYLYDMSRCVFCAMCVEVCPELALVMTHEFELGVDDRSQLVLDAEAMLKLADKHQERTGHPIEEPGFPAITDANSTIVKHSDLDPRIQRGNFQSHQPLLGKAPHGYPMKYSEFLEKERQGKPLAQGNLPPVLREIQNQYLADDSKTPVSKVGKSMTDGILTDRTHLLTAAQINPAIKHVIVDDKDGQGGRGPIVENKDL